MSAYSSGPSAKKPLTFDRRNVNQGGLDEPTQMDVLLAPLRHPASIRDIKQIFFYAQRLGTLNTGNIPGLEPAVVYPSLPYTPPGGGPWTDDLPNAVAVQQILWPQHDSYIDSELGKGIIKNSYPVKSYAIINPLGTQLKMNIASLVSQFYDIRVPRDKYVLELSLVECQIDSSPSNYLKTFKQDEQNDRIYDIKYNTTQPQTLFCRIKEASNGEPFNWTVTNTGVYANDRSHAVVVNFGDLSYSELTLEFGHLDMNGLVMAPEILKPSAIIQASDGRAAQPQVSDEHYGIPPGEFDVLRRQQSSYPVPTQTIPVDGQRTSTVQPPETPTNLNPGTYPDINSATWNVIGARDFQKGATYYDYNRAQYIDRPGGEFGDNPSTIVRDEVPLFFNQQAINIEWRFMVKMIHLF